MFCMVWCELRALLEPLQKDVLWGKDSILFEQLLVKELPDKMLRSVMRKAMVKST